MSSLLKLRGKDSRTIYSPLGQRVYGLVHIAQGLMMVIYGKRTPSWTLAFARWGAQYKHSRAQNS